MRALRIALVALAVLAVAAPAASAHATLEGTTPARGAALKAEPKQVVFRFNEPVEGTFGAVRVFDAKGKRVDDNHVSHPVGAGARIAVGLRSGLAHGAYTATYRVISADGHPVSGGIVFDLGPAGAAPAESVADLLSGAKAGPQTAVAPSSTMPAAVVAAPTAAASTSRRVARRANGAAAPGSAAARRACLLYTSPSPRD